MIAMGSLAILNYFDYFWASFVIISLCLTCKGIISSLTFCLLADYLPPKGVIIGVGSLVFFRFCSGLLLPLGI